MTAIHDRARRSGYDPPTMHRAKVLLAGAGAAGTNIGLDLMLGGIGALLVVDDDNFEGHNATRTPGYPSREAVARLGMAKAPNVAAWLRAIATAPHPTVMYFEGVLQSLGDAAITWADVVVSAVDNTTARGFLAERCRIHATPMFELGFSGSDFSFAAYSPTEGPCYRCHTPDSESSASCTRYALEAEAQHVIPAIQTAAATVSAFLAEQVSDALHDRCRTYGTRFVGNVRTPRLQAVTLPVEDQCPGFHTPVEGVGAVTLGSDRFVDLVSSVDKVTGGARLIFPEPVIITINCTRCRHACTVRALESSWMRDPRCVDCGGRWLRTADEVAPPEAIVDLSTREIEAHLTGLSCAKLGLRPGGAVMVHDEHGLGMVSITGDITESVTTATVTSDAEIAIPRAQHAKPDAGSVSGNEERPARAT